MPAHLIHGMTTSAEYRAWGHMFQRIKRPSYAAKGIKVCRRWQVFDNFYEDMGPRPSPRHSIERVDNNGDYAPNNCKWATPKEQNNNRGAYNVRYIYEGQTRSVQEIAASLGIKPATLYKRIERWGNSPRTFRPGRERIRA